MYSVKVRYFAILKEKSNVDEEVVLTSAKSPRELYEELAQKYDFSLPASMIKVAVNNEFSKMNSEIIENSCVVFIPPVAGG